MKIIINAYQYASAVTGTDRMAINFLTELQKLDTDNQYYIICSSESYNRSAINKGRNFKVICPPTFFGLKIAERVMNKTYRELVHYYLKTLKADVYFSFHNMQLPKFRVAKRMVASNLDLIPLVLDEYKDLVPGQAKEIMRVAQAADAFMSISHFSKDELCRLLNVRPNKVTVIHLAADERFFAKASEPGNLSLPPNFILTLGGSEPRKNVYTVTEAFSKLPEALQKKYPLLIAGGSWHGLPLKPLEQNAYIHALGYVSEEDLAILYQRSTAFIFASKYEGFGFTILEAMASEAPVISANSSSLGEVAGKAALLFAPTDVNGLTAHIKQVLTDSGLRQKLIEAGKKQNRQFSWTEAAQKLHMLLTT